MMTTITGGSAAVICIQPACTQRAGLRRPARCRGSGEEQNQRPMAPPANAPDHANALLVPIIELASRAPR
jgi:hypothetical protein